MLVIGMSFSASAALTEQISSNTISTPAFLLDYHKDDGDIATKRNGLKTEIQLHFFRTIFDFAYKSKYRVAYQLKKDGASYIKLEEAKITTPLIAYSDELVIPPKSSTGDYNPKVTVHPDPKTTLANQSTYTVEAKLQYWNGSVWVDIGTPTSSAASGPEYVHHFTQAASGDINYNIRPVIHGVTWNRKYLLDASATQSTLLATVETVFARYDDWTVRPHLNTSRITFDFDLIEESSGRSVGLENDGVVTSNWSALSYDNGGSERLPVFSHVTKMAKLRPTEQLKSASEQYILKCTIAHVETLIPSVRTDGIVELTPTGLLHFNGTLNFRTIATRFDALFNTPAYGTASGSVVTSTLQIPVGHGTLPQNSQYVYAHNTPLGVKLYDDGHASVTSGSETVYDPSHPLNDVTKTSGSVLFTYGTVTLSTNGASAATVQVRLPQGNIFLADTHSESQRGSPTVTRPSPTALDGSLKIKNPFTLTFGANAAMVDESHPLIIGVGNLTVYPTGGLEYGNISDIHYIHEEAYTKLDDYLASGKIYAVNEDGKSLIDRASNDRYWKTVNSITSQTVEIEAASDGSSRINADIVFDSQDYQTHFPIYADVSWSGGAETTMKGGDHYPSANMDDVGKIYVPYYRNCAGSACGDGVSPVSVQMEPNNRTLSLTKNGGVICEGPLTAAQSISWGARGDGSGNISPEYPYAHRTDKLGGGTFYAAGYHLYAEDNPLLKSPVYAAGGGDNAPAALMLAGFTGKGVSGMTFPTELDYIDGTGSYSGLNFVSKSQGVGASRIGGNQTDYEYTLMDDASKYYIRSAGVFGRQVGVEGSFPPTLKIYDYDFQLTSFQLTFIASEQEDSWINGAVAVSGYCNFEQRFLGLNLNCVGELEGAQIDPKDNDAKQMTYWNSEFSPKAIKFETAQTSPAYTCPVTFQGFLTMGVETRVAHIPTSIYGKFAFNASDGNLLTQTTGASIGIDSELGIPSNITLDGPAKNYTLVPTGKLRFSNPVATSGTGPGFVTFASTINVPYFQDFQVQVLTSANDTPAAALYLTPGWTSGGETFFSDLTFDPDHVSWPMGSITLAEYQSPDESTNPTYLIKAEQDMFGLIALSYPMKWNDTTRAFASMTPETDDLFVLNIDHQVDYLDAGTAKVSFGAQYDGLPKISLANMLNGQIDEAANSVSDALTAPLKGAIDQAFEEFDKLLADSLDAVIDPVVDTAADEVLRPLYQDVKGKYTTLRASGGDWSDFEGELDKLIASRLFDQADLAAVTAMRNQLRELSQTGANAASLTKDLRESIEQVIIGIDCISARVKLAPGSIPEFTPDLSTLTNADSPGLLYKSNGGQREIVQSLVKLLLENLVSPELSTVLMPLLSDATSDLNNELNAQLQEIDPSLEQITKALTKVREFLLVVHTQIVNAEGFIDDFNEVVNQALNSTTEFQSLMARPASRALNFFKEMARDNGFDVDGAGTMALDSRLDLFEEFDEDQFVELIKMELKDALIQSDMIQQYKYLLRQALYDVQNKMEQTVGTVLSEITGVMKKVISSTVGEIEAQINPMLGKVNAYMGTANVDGYAEFNGDSLRKLRMDAALEMKVPDDLHLDIFLEINAYTSSDAATGCLAEGEKAVEVTIGATDVALDWISDDLRATLTTKMSLKDEGSGMFPNGVGGGFELTGGEIDFQSFIITEFGATLAIGGDEAFLGAKGHGKFNAYELGLGIFFGRTCRVDPLVLVDSDVGSLFSADKMPLTGAYVYGEVWLPISEMALGIPSSCMFSISAGVGTGIGFFMDDSLSPVFVGKMYAGISGEALCIVSIKGEVTMVGIVQDGSFSASGTGKLKGKAGACPFCIKFSTSAKISYSNGDWDVDY